MKTKTIGFIGAGNMATNIISAILEKGIFKASDIFVNDISVERLNSISKHGVKVCHSSNELVLNSDIVFLAVKPQNVEEVLTNIKSNVENSKLFVSILAGISSSYIRKLLGCDVPVIRLMPNTPLLISEGSTAISKTSNVNEEDFKVINNLFSECGKVERINENQMNDIIPINGSSPAYIYLFAKAFLDFAKNKNIDDNVAKKLFVQALIGSAKMIESSNCSIDELINQVQSPNGTTIEGTNVLYKNNFLETLEKALEACANRALELEK